MTRRIHVALYDPGSSRPELNEPIGTGTLASALRSRLGPAVRVEQFFEPINGAPGGDVLRETDILGVSTPLGRVPEVAAIIERWRALDVERRPLLVLGGLTATFAEREILEHFPEAILVLGEGEEALVSIAELYLGATDGLRSELVRRDVPNLVLRLGGRTVRTTRRNIVVDDFPAPERPFVSELVQRGGIVRAEASRGCSWGRCTFCAIQHKYSDRAEWRGIAIPRIVGELAALSASGVRFPYFTDEDFVGDQPERAIELADAITRAKARGEIAQDLRLYADFRVSSVLAPERRGRPSGVSVLRALQRAGLSEVFVGIESGAREQVKRYLKPATARRNLQALELLRGLGLELDIGFIFFDPEMSLEEARANLRFIREAGLWGHPARLTKELRVEAGTPLLAAYREKGLLTGPMDIDELTFPYRWLDSRVEELYHRFREWEAQEEERVYALQAATRGEVESEADRKRLRALLGSVRSVELDALQALTDAIAEGRPAAGVELGPFGERRARALAAWDGKLGMGRSAAA